MSADPLSFFAVDSDDSSDSEEDGIQDDVDKKAVPENVQKTNNCKVLPPPMDALAEAKRPEFTINPLGQGINWDKLTKKAPVLPEKEYKPWENSLPSFNSSVKSESGKAQLTLAQQVPGASAPIPRSKGSNSDEIVDRAMTWSKMYQDLDQDGHLKRVRPEDIGGEEGFLFTDLEAQKVAFSGVKRKTGDKPVGHRAKEAKKRNLGQSNREKMFVEEEKRVLRQDFDTNF